MIVYILIFMIPLGGITEIGFYTLLMHYIKWYHDMYWIDRTWIHKVHSFSSRSTIKLKLKNAQFVYA